MSPVAVARLRRLRPWLIAVAVPLLLLWLLDLAYPLPAPPGGFSTVVTARDGTPLRAFADDDGVWRYPTVPRQVSPLYLEALLGYEDRWFYRHPGVNPFALLRAVGQWWRYGRPISGGSTLTMQVARLLEPYDRSPAGKLRQALRALQLEWHLSKEEILTLYLDHAPFGGPLEGVEAASYAYLGKSARELSHAEAALLAVLPQSPSRLRPDRHPQRARAARDKVLTRLARLGVWPEQAVKEALEEPVEARFQARPLFAPLLARRFRDAGGGGGRVTTTIDPFLQQALEGRFQQLAGRLPEKSSAALLVVENGGMEVRAYLGSLDFMDHRRFGHVDMVRAIRSPGSTLKPFLYGLAIEEGLIHSESLLADAPLTLRGYRPGNFTGGFAGPVSAREALQRSLNVPAVDLLERLGPELFAARLRNGGLRLTFPEGGGPNPAMILGGVGTTLEGLTALYAALGRGGLAAPLRYREEEPLAERRLLCAGAAWIVRDMLEGNPRPDLARDAAELISARRVAWKSGTSYGFRDAWAIGVGDRYTVGVWVGRPDGTPLPGHFGAVTAAPILFEAMDSLGSAAAPRPPRPATVSEATVCWPLGTPPGGTDDPLCHRRMRAWSLDGMLPPTLPDRDERQWNGGVTTLWINPVNGLRVDAGCPVASRRPLTLARWPAALEPWLTPDLRARALPPAADPACPSPPPLAGGTLRIVGLPADAVLRPAPESHAAPLVTLTAGGARGPVYWLLDGRPLAAGGPDGVLRRRFREPGRHELTLLDELGDYDRIAFTVASP